MPLSFSSPAIHDNTKEKGQNITFNRIDDTVLGRLREIVGDEHVSVSPDDMQKYSHDEVLDLHHEPETAA